MLTIPNGLNEIVQVFGPLSKVPSQLVTFVLPYPMLYGTTTVHRATCHKLAERSMFGALQSVRDAKLETMVLRFGGIYNNRVKQDGREPSTHAWGIAIDLEPERYPLGSDARFPKVIVDIFKHFGFIYGGDFEKRPDPMHFQLCSGY